MSTNKLIETNNKILLLQKGRALLNKLHKRSFQQTKSFYYKKGFILFFININIFCDGHNIEGLDKLHISCDFVIISGLIVSINTTRSLDAECKKHMGFVSKTFRIKQLCGVPVSKSL